MFYPNIGECELTPNPLPSARSLIRVQGTACKAGVRFLSFDAIKNKLVDSNGKLSPGRGILAGMTAGAVESVLVVTPTERIKTAL